MERISTADKHECKFISGKVGNVHLGNGNRPFCGSCGEELLWTQVAEHLQHFKDKDRGGMRRN